MIAVDWSGKANGPAESLWRAEVRDGKLTELRNGLDRGELIAKLLELGEAEPSMVIGLDFAFSFPRVVVRGERLVQRGGRVVGDVAWGRGSA